MRNSALRWLGASVLLLPVVTWYARHQAAAGAAARWDVHAYITSEARVDAMASAQPGDLPSRGDQLLDYAFFQSDEAFPSNYDAADEAIVRAIGLQPLNSHLWLQLARQCYFRRDLPGAAAALGRSDALSPGYTSERLDSLELRELMGDRAGVIEVARRVAAAHPASAEKAARHLASLGLPCAEILGATAPLGTPPEQVARILETLKPASVDEAEELLATIIGDYPPDSTLRRVALRSAIEAKAPRAIIALWEALGEPRLSALPGSAELAMRDPLLLSDPSLMPSPLGWQMTAAKGIASRWESGRIRLVFDSSSNEDDRTSRYRFLRVPIPANDSATVWNVRVSSAEPLRSRVRLMINDGLKTYTSSLTSLDSDGSGTLLQLQVPPHDGLRIAEVSIERYREGSSAIEGVYLDLSDLAVDDRPVEPPQ